jgi:hypothetical protein
MHSKYNTIGRRINTPEGECTITNIFPRGVAAYTEEWDDDKFFEYSEINPILSETEKAEEAKAQRAAWVREQEMAFLQSEGYFETPSKTIECQTLAQWLKLAEALQPNITTEPYHKSDLGYGL